MPKTKSQCAEAPAHSKLPSAIARLKRRPRFEVRLGFAALELRDRALQSVCRFLNDLPTLAQMFFCGEHVAEADPHYRSAAQFCLREICAPGRVDSLYDVAVDSGRCDPLSRRAARAAAPGSASGGRRSNKPKTDHAHAGLRG